MKYMYTNKPDETCHKISGVYGRAVNTQEQLKLKAKGWTFKPEEVEKKEPKKEAKKELSIPEQAKALGIATEQDGKKIHYKLLAKAIEAHNGGTDKG